MQAQLSQHQPRAEGEQVPAGDRHAVRAGREGLQPPEGLSQGPHEGLPIRAFAVVLSTQLAFGFCFSAFFILPKFLATELQASAKTIGEVAAATMAAAVVAVPLVGTWLDKYGRRVFITLGAAVSGAAGLGFIWVHEVGPLLFALRIAQGVAFTFAFNAAATVVTDLTPPARLGRALGIFGASMLVTNGLAPYLLEPLAEARGWHPVFAVSALAGFLAAGLSLLIREPARPLAQAQHQTKHRPQPASGSAPDLEPRPAHTHNPESFAVLTLAPILVAAAAAGAGFGVAVTFYQPFALELGMDRVRGYFAGFTLAAITARLFLGGLADRIGRRLVAVVALLLYGASLMAMAWLRPGMLEVLGAGLGLAHGLFYPALNALAVADTPDAARGRVMSFFNGAFNVGFGASIWALGLVAVKVGYPPVFLGVGALLHAAALVLVMGSELCRPRLASPAASLLRAVRSKTTPPP